MEARKQHIIEALRFAIYNKRRLEKGWGYEVDSIQVAAWQQILNEMEDGHEQEEANKERARIHRVLNAKEVS